MLDFWQKLSPAKKIALLGGLLLVACLPLVILSAQRTQTYRSEAEQAPFSQSASIIPARYDNPGQGVFVCHTPSSMGKAYIKGGGVIVFWGKLQPQSPDQFDQAALDELVGQIKDHGKKVYLHFMIYPEGGHSYAETYPNWLHPSNVQWIKTSVGDFPAPWDTAYQQKLQKFLTLLNQALAQRQVGDKVEYLEPASGGRFGTTHLYFREDDFGQWMKAAGCNGPDYQCLSQKYTQGVNKIYELYNQAFPDYPLMLVSGSALHGPGYSGFNQLLQRYGLKVMIKGAGLGTRESDCGIRASLLNPLCRYAANKEVTKCGQEPWGPSINCNNPNMGFDPASACGKNYDQVYRDSLKNEAISYYCLYTHDAGCAESQAVNQLVADSLGAQIRLANPQLSTTDLRVNDPLSITLRWFNCGSTALNVPLKQGEKWSASSYKLFLEFVQNGQVRHYQELAINPPTNTWQPKTSAGDCFETNSSFNLNISTVLGSSQTSGQETYQLFAGLTDPNGEKRRFALINPEAANDTQNRRYLLANNFVVRGQGSPASPTPTSPASQPTLAPLTPPGGEGEELVFRIKFSGVAAGAPGTADLNLIFKQDGITKYQWPIPVSALDNGAYTGTVNVPPGVYTPCIKGWAHLQRCFEDIKIFADAPNGANWIKKPLLPGDFDSSNTLDIVDLVLLIEKYTSLRVPVNDQNKKFDVNLDNRIDIFDIALVLQNYTALSVEGEE